MSPKICFIALSAYPLLARKNLGHVIGPDVYQVLLANELLKHNFEISFITYNEGGPHVEHLNRIEVIKIYSMANCSNLVLKGFHVWRAMSKARAAIYFQQGGAPGIAPLFCRLWKKPLVVSVASDAFVDRRIKDTSLVKKKRLAAWLDIKLANAVIVQTEFQREMLKKNFGVDGLLIKNPFPLVHRGAPEKTKPAVVLWVGAVAEVKQPELFLQLAQALPEAKFEMIAARGDNENYYRRIEQSVNQIPNLIFLGFVPFNQVNRYFGSASVLVNTSKFEGFPNAFIQAWMNYSPVVSLNSDPDEIICKHKLGFHSKSFNQLKEDVKTLLKDEQLREEMGRNARQYVEKEHDITKIVNQYVEVFKHL